MQPDAHLTRGIDQLRFLRLGRVRQEGTVALERTAGEQMRKRSLFNRRTPQIQAS